MKPRVKPGTFLLLCCIAGALLIPLLVALMAVAGLVLDPFIPGDMPRDLEGIYGLQVAAMFGLLAGLAIGQLQFFSSNAVSILACRAGEGSRLLGACWGRLLPGLWPASPTTTSCG